MSKHEKLMLKILSATSDNNISFKDVCNLLDRFEFKSRIKGSLHIFFKQGVEEILNLQPKGTKAKPYQVKQVRNIIIKYKLS